MIKPSEEEKSFLFSESVLFVTPHTENLRSLTTRTLSCSFRSVLLETERGDLSSEFILRLLLRLVTLRAFPSSP